MGPIDWRELYAANREVIEAGRGASHRRASSPTAPAWEPAPGTRVAGGASPERPGGAGTWERFTYSGAEGARPYFLYRPRGLDAGAMAPLLVMLHGCTQTPVDLARGTRMNDAADRHGFLVAYPQQTGRHNQRACWNWFLPHHQARGSGEPGVLAGITREVIAGLDRVVDPERVFLAGMSAGAAMAAVMGATYPDLFAAIGVHSGIPYRVATSQHGAFEAMARGAADPAGRGREAFAAMGDRARVVPIIVVHGTGDNVVCPVNGDQVVEQWLAVNRLAAPDRFEGELRRPSAVVPGQVEQGHDYTRYHWNDARGRLFQEYLKVQRLGHAWSGGGETGSYTDPRGPDASQAMWDFFAQVGSGPGPSGDGAGARA
jgi:poly(hydroxyalkanoate) depolymerase family esterase